MKPSKEMKTFLKLRLLALLFIPNYIPMKMVNFNIYSLIVNKCNNFDGIGCVLLLF